LKSGKARIAGKKGEGQAEGGLQRFYITQTIKCNACAEESAKERAEKWGEVGERESSCILTLLRHEESGRSRRRKGRRECNNKSKISTKRN